MQRSKDNCLKTQGLKALEAQGRGESSSGDKNMRLIGSLYKEGKILLTTLPPPTPRRQEL